MGSPHTAPGFPARFALLGLSLVSLAAPSAAQSFSPSLYQEMRWRMIGPFRGGRTRAAAGVPGRKGVFYAGAVDGGVWRSDDFGRTWTPIFDDQPTQSIGDIAVAPSDPDIVYVASGEGLQRPDLSVGDGIYRSPDGGKSWVHLGLRNGQQIPRLAVDPRNPDRLFAAVLGHPFGAGGERGLFRSGDGGKSWRRILPADEDTGASDVAIDPAHPDTLYASLWRARLGPWEDHNEYGGAGGGLFRSTDGGETWKKLAGGLPDDLVQIRVAIAPSKTRRLYAAVATLRETAIYRSEDGGERWERTTTDPRPARRIGGGDLPVPVVDPKNPDVVYSTSTVTWRSEDAGKTWTGIKGAPGGDDYQNLWIDPGDPDVLLLVGDQGAAVSVNRGATWSSWYNQPTAQLFHAIADDSFPYRVCGGQQESGSVCISSRGNDGAVTFREWHPAGVIEYGYAAPDPLHPGIVYGGGRDEVSRYDERTGQVQNVTPIPVRSGTYRTDRTEPVVFSPVDPRVLYYAANVLFRTEDGGRTWRTISPDLTRERPGIPASLGSLADADPYARTVRGAIYALAPSFKTVSTLWAGTDDGSIWRTADGGAHWKNVTPEGLSPWSKVTQIAASRFDDVSAYASVSRFRVDDLRPYVYRTHDGGKRWDLITAGLPEDAPVNAVREDPVRRGLLFAGTEKEVWVSFDDGDHWQTLQLNLPRTSMRDLWIHDRDLIVATHGRSFWILDDLSPLRQIDAAVAASEIHLFRPAPAVRVKRDTNTDTPLPPDEPAGRNPPDGAVIDYVLARALPGPVVLEILDAAGRPVRRFSSADPPEATEEDLQKNAPVPLYWLRRASPLSAEAGMHRWVWDLHYPPPGSERHEYPISAIPGDTPRLPLGPTALPGRYTVRLTAGPAVLSVPLEVTMDPRVKAAPADLERLFRSETNLVSRMNRAYDTTLRARSLKERLDPLSKRTEPGLAERASALAAKLSSLLGTRPGYLEPVAPQPTLGRVTGDLATLYAQVGQADAAPTAAQEKAAAVAGADLEGLMKTWAGIETGDLPALNRLLRDSGLPELSAEPRGEPEKEPPDDD